MCRSNGSGMCVSHAPTIELHSRQMCCVRSSERSARATCISFSRYRMSWSEFTNLIRQYDAAAHRPSPSVCSWNASP